MATSAEPCGEQIFYFLQILGGDHFRKVRKILVSVKFLSAILGPEMAAPILWTRRISAFFPQENLHVQKIPHFRGDFVFGGGKYRFYLWARGFF